MTPRRVLVSFPTSPSSPYLHKHVVFFSWQLLRERRHQVTPIIPSHTPLENNFHHIMRQVLDEGYDFWLSIDHDNPPMGNPLDLVEYNRDIVGFPTPVWHYTGQPRERPLYWTGYDYVPEEDAYREHQPREGLQPVDAIGGGCFLIARRVLLHPEMQKAPWTRILHPDGRVSKGADIAFCERARAAGFSIFCDYDRPCRHFKELELNEVAEAFRKLYEVD